MFVDVFAPVKIMSLTESSVYATSTIVSAVEFDT